MNKLLHLLILFSATIITAKSQWTVLIYADPTQTLTDAILKNINDAAQIGSSDNSTIFVQLRTYTSKNTDDALAWRYRIEKNTLILEDCIKPTGDYTKDIVDAAQWAFGKEATEYHAFILSGHGHGILQPTWDPINNEWQLEPDDAQSMCQLKHVPKEEQHRAVLMNEITQHYMTNKEMCAVFKGVYDIIGKKIDVVGFDLCLGASLEHAYQLSPWVNYFVGCQTCELVDGFEFCGFAHRLSQKNCTPLNLVQGIVQDYNNYYQTKAVQHIYTLSAIDCQKVMSIMSALDNAVEMLNTLVQQEPSFKKLFLNARKQCTNFCFVPMYTDLYMCAEALQKVLMPLNSTTAQKAEQALNEVKNCITEAIVANVTGSKITAYGINIYYPYSHIDSSYIEVPFAQASTWIEFLKNCVTA